MPPSAMSAQRVHFVAFAHSRMAWICGLQRPSRRGSCRSSPADADLDAVRAQPH